MRYRNQGQARFRDQEAAAERRAQRGEVDDMAEADMEKARVEFGSGQRQTEPVGGLEREPYGNHPQPRGSDLAAGHASGPPRVPDADTMQLDYQPPQLRPSPVPVITADASFNGPLAAAITAHVALGQVRHDRASQPQLDPQLGANAPMGPEGAARQMPGAHGQVATASDQPGRPASPAPHQDGQRGPGVFLTGRR